MDALDSVDMLKIECVVPDALGERAVDVIRSAAHTGSPGDGRIVVSDVDSVIRIGTGQRDEESL